MLHIESQQDWSKRLPLMNEVLLHLKSEIDALASLTYVYPYYNTKSILSHCCPAFLPHWPYDNFGKGNNVFTMSYIYKCGYLYWQFA